MGRRLNVALGGVAVGAVVSLVSNVRSQRQDFAERIGREIDDLLASSGPDAGEVVTEEDIAGLPEPVRRWLRWSGVVGRKRPATVRLRQSGELRLGNSGWFPFVAEEYFTTDPPGFVWAARMTMAPGVTVIGRDRYAGGKGSIDMRLLGVVAVASDRGPEMDRGALLRYLNEIMWFPAGAISPAIAWEPLDGESARATITHGEVGASATFRFDREGRLTDMVAERYDREAGRVLPWSTPITDYGEFGGVRVPVAGEAVYARGEGDVPYIRLRVTTLEHDRPERFRPGAVLDD
jgi:hypothetical protein